jgi:type IV secretory pathway TrbF-like protein
MLRTTLQAPKTAEAMSQNPIGLYIDEMHWDCVRRPIVNTDSSAS